MFLLSLTPLTLGDQKVTSLAPVPLGDRYSNKI